MRYANFFNRSSVAAACHARQNRTPNTVVSVGRISPLFPLPIPTGDNSIRYLPIVILRLPPLLGNNEYPVALLNNSIMIARIVKKPTPTHPNRLPRRCRIRAKRDFDRIFAQRRSAADKLLIVYVGENNMPHARIGLAVSRRVGNAIRRNRIRRCIREAFRLHQADIPTGVDIICVARPTDTTPTMPDYAESLVKLIKKAFGKQSAHRKDQK